MSDTENSPRHELDPDREPDSLPAYYDTPPTVDEVHAVREEARDVLEQSEMAAGRLEHAHVERVATRVARKESRRYGMWGALFAGLLGLAVALVAISVALPAASQAQTAASTAQHADQQARTAQQTVADALGQLNETNKALEARGQAPVTTSATPDQSEAIGAAVLAKVLLQLPKAPSAEQVAAILQPTVSAQVTGPSTTTLAGLVAAYFVEHPPGPTPAQIQDAVDTYVSQHPPKDGVDGHDGRDGNNGKDGESPPCLFEPAQCRGSDSTVAGPPGPPVASWTWPDPVLPNVSHTCTRSGGTDDAATYSCT